MKVLIKASVLATMSVSSFSSFANCSSDLEGLLQVTSQDSNQSAGASIAAQALETDGSCKIRTNGIVMTWPASRIDDFTITLDKSSHNLGGAVGASRTENNSRGSIVGITCLIWPRTCGG